jgi:hypothetical protein
MAKFDSLTTERKTEQDVDFVRASHCHKCNSEASLTLYDVQDKHSGKTVRGAASEYSHYGKDNNCTWRARDNFTVLGSVGWCGDCYLAMMQEQRVSNG